MPRQGVTGASWLHMSAVPGVTNCPGGFVELLTAAAALNVGDAVYASANDTVDKSASAGNQGKAVGIVVGGESTGFECCDQATDVGAAAATAANQKVWVLRKGKCFVPTDAAIAAGVSIAMSTGTAGKVRPATNPVIAAGAVAVTSSAANGAIVTGDGFGTIIGRMIEATVGAATGLAFISTI